MSRFTRTHTSRRPSLRRRRAASAPIVGAAIETLESRVMLSTGGGWGGGGLVGNYYANNNESGTAEFSRTDVRLDWAENAASPAGSDAPGFSAIGATDWSASWTGTLLPKYSESYTFQMVADGAVNMQISPNGTTWTTLFATTTTLGGQTLTSASYAMTAGTAYQVKITFSQQDVPQDTSWGLQLNWSSPSTPLETIDPANPIGVDPGAISDFGVSYEWHFPKL